MIASPRRRMDLGTIQRIGGLVMRYGLRSQLAPLDCTSSRRSTVMCALLRATVVTTEYQRDSSSKRPKSSVVLVARFRRSRWTLPQRWTQKNAPTAAVENDRAVFHSDHRHLTTGHSISARQYGCRSRALPHVVDRGLRALSRAGS